MPNERNISAVSRLFHPALVWLLRVAVGATFVLSGFVKSVDPWGSVIKIGEYLSVWGWDIPSALVTFAAFMLGGIEFVFGALLLLGCYRRVSVWILMAMMCFMLPLTFYIMIDNPVSDCGCFGDFLIISNSATFVKNLFLTLFLVYLIKFNAKVSGLFIAYVQWIVGGVLSFYILAVAFYSYNVQPMIDFRRFAPETRLVQSDEDLDKESSDEEPIFEYFYERDGDRKTFLIDNLPDSTWSFVGRKLIDGSTEIKDGFTLIEDGEDIASDVIEQEGEQFIVTIPNIKNVDLSYTYLINELNDFITSRDGSLIVLVNSDDRGIEWWKDVSMASYPIYNAEPNLIMELARGNAALVYLNDGVVQWKRTLSSISYTFVTETPDDELIDALAPEPLFVLESFSGIAGVILLVIFIFDRSGKLVAWLIRRRKKHKVIETAGETVEK
ncbi:MAG: DoxX family protein [Duncaniella sp.]|nr:DoxX family protein [Duncaniella sp.]